MENLKEKLLLHKEWLLDNTKGKRLDLSGANLVVQTLVMQTLDIV